jgi:cell division protein ZapA
MSQAEGVDKETVTVEILGEEYVLKSEASPEYTRRVAEHVDQMASEIREDGGIMDTKRLAILTALAITDQLFRVKEGVDRVRGAVERRAERLTREVLEVVEKEPGS